jgi:hypothetical protein
MSRRNFLGFSAAGAAGFAVAAHPVACAAQSVGVKPGDLPDLMIKMLGRILAFDSIQGVGQYILVARGVFKETTTHRATPGMGPRRGKLDDAQKQVIRESLDEYLKPYLRA